ncbi:SidA/IucD/PvdA family monooxygenase [Glutamicibacter sp. JL.03c]|uniref:lysine N(6)-hydroxylase/L-ornithine N(5)-oxygenase family protein n=1 Tax=Glutamicibacter sp. JL.03c TaxID=2984842 RepID=UPI0021F6C1CC|nr:SidA/IucD/PvdA family monooxygenase [Glutamicibacter sp. JL.03c]UYQ78419.1 SidA/IucD/PvdA family monooxygenase [Glutamicibacter sp. JL.03c]
MNQPSEHFDVIAIGAGPFNLGFAALTDGIEDLKVAVLDAAEKFVWHPGMMLPGTHLQVPFMADLVTMADPTNKYSFLNYLKGQQRIYPFYIREDFYALRQEYSNYLAWAAESIQSVRFGHRVLECEYRDGLYNLSVLTEAGMSRFTAQKLVLGTGTQPYLPPVISENALSTGKVVHSSDYLFERDGLVASTGSARAKVTCVVGSGQSAAEIFLDLLRSLPEEDHLIWATRSERYFPLEYTKLTLEMTSPEYIDHFHGLPMAKRDELSSEQKGLYKGINADLINEIHEELYERSIAAPANVHLRTGCAATSITADDQNIYVSLRHERTEKDLDFAVDNLVMATGYRAGVPDFLGGITERISYLADGRFNVDREYSIGLEQDIFVQNAELHTHGFTAPDLGMGAYRNSVIINRLAGREVYQVEERIAFQEFGAAELTGLPTAAPATSHA